MLLHHHHHHRLKRRSTHLAASDMYPDDNNDVVVVVVVLITVVAVRRHWRRHFSVVKLLQPTSQTHRRTTVQLSLLLLAGHSGHSMCCSPVRDFRFLYVSSQLLWRRRYWHQTRFKSPYQPRRMVSNETRMNRSFVVASVRCWVSNHEMLTIGNDTQLKGELPTQQRSSPWNCPCSWVECIKY